MTGARWLRLGCVVLAAACSDGQLDAFTRLSPDSAPAPAGAAGGPPSPGLVGGDSSTGGTRAPAAAGLAGGEAGPEARAGAGGAAELPGQGLLLLDDFEDGDTRGLNETGHWYPVDDGTGDQLLTIEPLTRESSALAIRAQGGGFSDWGAKLGLDLSGSDDPLDASSYRTLVFFARAEPGSLTSIRVVLLDHTAHYGKDLELTQSWQRYVIAFSELTRPDGSGGLDTSRLEHLQFFAGPSAPFDYWIDDVALAP